MARIRSIKPEFFFDEELAQLDPKIRLFYIGLWTCADREGKIEHRCAKIKACIFPYEEFDPTHALNMLKKFVFQYEVNGKKYLKINNFLKHQRPHHTEQPSIIPNPKVKQRCSNRVETVQEREEKGKDNGEGEDQDRHFEIIWNKYPKKLGKDRAFKSFKSSVKSEGDVKNITAAIEKYLEHLRVSKTEEKYIQHGSTWFNNWKDWVNYKPTEFNNAPKFRTADEVLAARKQRQEEETKNAGSK